MPSGIRNKLIAAIAMLLIAAIMMVMSTYAWFTLSTAPEVTGITTNVGANGNLEMMLLNKDSFASGADDLGVVSSVGDSYAVKDIEEANMTWGNLVDLSAASYGLSDIVLMPARLNVASADTVNNSILLAPSYGTDGRVIDVNTATYSGAKDGNTWTYKELTDHAGVRAIGTSSGVTQRLSAYRTAKSAITTNTDAAKNAAQTSLTSNGQTLANIVMRHVTAKADESYTLDEVKALQNMITSLKTANAKAGDAIVQAVLANSLSAAQTAALTDEQVTALVNSFANVTPSTLPTDNVVLPAGFDAAKAQWETNNTTINAAKTSVDALVGEAKTSYAYADIEGIVDQLINKEHTTVAGVKNPKKSDLNAIIQNVTANDMTVIMEMEDGAGIYADIAKLIGDITASGFTVTVTQDSLEATAKAVIKTIGHDSPLVSAITVGNAPAATPAAGTKTILADTYGYALDLGFRTNAAASNLLLQTAEKQRVYDSGEAANTQGGGSYMQFTSGNVKTFSVSEVRALMSAIRVAFVAPNDTTDATTYKILGLGKLDITGTLNSTSGITTYTGGKVTDQNGNVLADGTADDAANAAGIKADLFLCNYTYDSESNALTVGDKKADQSALTALTQNKAQKVTVIVYLDGDIVDNTMVANAAESMSGKLNLQFSSSATLKPMENTGMRQGGTPGMGAPTVTYTQKAAAGDTYTFKNMTGTVKAGYTIYEGSDGNIYYSTNGTRYTQLTSSNLANAVTVSSSNP